MSNRILTNTELNQIVTYAMHCGANRVTKLDFEASSKLFPFLEYQELTAQELGSWLKGPNVWSYEAVNGKGSAEKDIDYTYEEDTSVSDALEFLALLTQYYYHCSLWQGWFLSDQKEMINGLFYRIVQEIILQSEASNEQ